MAELRRECEDAVARLRRDFEASFPPGDPAAAQFVEVADAHYRRLDEWRRKWLDDESSTTRTPFRRELERFEIAVKNFDRETRLLNAARKLTPEEFQTRDRDYLDGKAMIERDGPLLSLYRTWLDRYKTASRDWKNRSRELERRRQYAQL
jgi:curved DNA-binding protein CbpA